MAYEFMREFTGVPLKLNTEQRLEAIRSFGRGITYLLVYYAETIMEQRTHPGSASLYLHHEAEAELLEMHVTTEEDLTVTDARLTLVGLARGVISESHAYTAENRGILRHDETDVSIQVLMDHDRFVAEGQAFLQALREGRDPRERSPEPDERIDMSGFAALDTDYVDAAEVGGLKGHIEFRIDNGLYVPVTSEQALELQGLI